MLTEGNASDERTCVSVSKYSGLIYITDIQLCTYSLQQNNLRIIVKNNMRSSFFSDVAQPRLVVSDVSGQPVGPIFKPPAIQEDCLTPDYETDRLSPDVGNYR